VLHVHDEAVCEVKESSSIKLKIENIVKELPEWAKGLPIDAESWIGNRYRK
jgi:DNA polymerase